MDTDEIELWVGEFDDGEVVLFDPDRQKPAEAEWTYLWSRETRRIEGYAKDIVTKVVRRTTDQVKVESAIASYFASHPAEKRPAGAQARRRHRPNHRQSVEGASLHCADTPTGGRYFRTAYCWACSESLHNRAGNECSACGWIRCECGACGCEV